LVYLHRHARLAVAAGLHGPRPSATLKKSLGSAMDKTLPNQVSRRSLFSASAAGLGVVAACAAPGAAHGAVPPTSAGEDGQGYCPTDHIKRYYELAKF
jgi:hypothetical protein